MIYLHDSDINSLDFPCGHQRTLFLREDITNLEAAAKKFETDDEVIDEIRRHEEGGDDLYSFPSSSKIQSIVDDGYYPYCEISFEVDEGACLTAQKGALESGESIKVSTICPSSDIARNITVTDNVSIAFPLPKFLLLLGFFSPRSQ